MMIRAYLETDKAWAHALNTACVPAVSDLSEDILWRLIKACAYTRVAVAADGTRLGMAMLMLPGQRYASTNYQWFCQRFDDFLYVDRIMVEAAGRGKGVGKALYDDIFALGRSIPNVKAIACEVNLKPMNAPSLKFHAALGFVSVGEQANQGGKKRVCLMRRALE